MEIISSLRNGMNSPSKGEFIFHSSDHIRYQNGQDVSGHNYGCNRSIKIQHNISGGDGYTITIFNEDTHPIWGNNIQMTPKQMKIVSVNAKAVILNGFGFDLMGFPFSNYGLTIIFMEERIEKCILHILDRGIDIEYLN